MAICFQKNTLFICGKVLKVSIAMGVCATAIFDIRNMDKVGHGDTGRVGAVAAQTTNLVNAASRSSIEPVQKVANTALNYIDDAGNVVGVTNAASKVTGFASKAVNPLLCVASGVRVLKDDDQYAALIEEGCAMGAMFAGEKLLKTLVANPIAQKEVKTTSKWATKIASTIQDATKNLTGAKKVLATIAADLALVGVSILSFDIGKKIGKKLSGRDEQDTINTSQSGLNYNS